MAFRTVGTADQPVRLKLPDRSWRLFAGGTGAPLYQKQSDGTWLVVAREGGATPIPSQGPVTVDAQELSIGNTGVITLPDSSGFERYARSSGDPLRIPYFAASSGGVDYLRFEAGTPNERGHTTPTAKVVTALYVDFNQIIREAHLGEIVTLPAGVTFPFDSWTHLTIEVGAAASYEYTHRRADGLNIYDIRDPDTETALANLTYSLRQVVPADTVTTELVTDIDGYPWRVASVDPAEPTGTAWATVSAASPFGGQTLTVPRGDLDNDRLAAVLVAHSTEPSPPTNDEYSNGYTRWEAYTITTSASANINVTIHWPSWTYQP